MFRMTLLPSSSSETFLSSHIITRRHNPEDHDTNLNRCEILKSRKMNVQHLVFSVMVLKMFKFVCGFYCKWFSCHIMDCPFTCLPCCKAPFRILQKPRFHKQNIAYKHPTLQNYKSRLKHVVMSGCSSIGRVNGCGLQYPGSINDRGTRISLCHHIQTGSESHTTSC